MNCSIRTLMASVKNGIIKNKHKKITAGRVITVPVDKA